MLSANHEGHDRKQKRNLQRRFYEAINGMESIGVIKKDKGSKMIELEELTFVEKLRKDQGKKEEVESQVQEMEMRI